MTKSAWARRGWWCRKSRVRVDAARTAQIIGITVIKTTLLLAIEMPLGNRYRNEKR
jgi:hypothetical protein